MLIPYNKTLQLRHGTVYMGELKGKKAFVHILHNTIHRVVLEDASHFFGELLHAVDFDELFIYIDELSPPPDHSELYAKQKTIDDLHARIRDLEEDKDGSERQCRITEKILNEKTIRQKEQLRAVFYMLEQLEGEGTHARKAIVIEYIRRCISSMLKHDRLDQYSGSDDLPF